MQLLSPGWTTLAARGERTTIVVATSGDTGGAAIDAPEAAPAPISSCCFRKAAPPTCSDG
jgi:threonine synthase